MSIFSIIFRLRRRPDLQSGKAAFSLVEVTIALGVVAFGLMVIIGLFVTLLNGAGRADDRREIMAALASLNSYLDDEVPFRTVYGWAANDAELAYVSYRADSSGNPAANGSEIHGRWEPVDGTWDGDYDTSRTSNWIRARLTLDEDLNPGDVTGDVDSYPHTYVTFQVELFSVPDRAISLDNQTPTMSTNIAVLR